MSRIGKLPIQIPAGVSVDISQENIITVKGPKGQLTQQVNPAIKVTQENGQMLLERPTDNKPHKSMHGLYRSLLNNMVVGVTEGYQKALDLVGTGYRAQVNGGKLMLNIGFSHPVEIDPPAGLTFETPAPTHIVVKGIDKQQVGNMAADIRAIRKPEPYLGKGIKYSDEIIRRKEGKSGKK